MKRDNRGNPIQTVHRWNRPPLSCQACRDKKRRCDRTFPCSNCALRNIPCEFSGQSPDSIGELQSSQGSNGVNSSQTGTTQPAPGLNQSSHNTDELLYRIRRLEDALIGRGNEIGASTSHRSTAETSTGSNYVTPFSIHHQSPSNNAADSPSINTISRKLPPLRQARVLFDHYAIVFQPTFGVLHIPSTRTLMENTYHCMLEGEEPLAADLMLLFGIFASAALAWTPQLLDQMDASREEARSAFIAYVRLALCILDHPCGLLQPSTTALVAIATVAHVVMNADGFPIKVYMLRHRCLLMSRELGIHRLDTAKSIEERQIKGCDMIDVEVKRRVWWNMVASDWLLAFSGGSQEGAYTFQPRHMNVNLPSNTDDEFITASGIQQEFPLSVPTAMSAFLLRVKGAQVCREIIDSLPSILLDSQEPDYETILALDTRCHNALGNLPVYFRLDPASIEQSKGICAERPYIAWQRLSIHFSLNVRLCRLHRPFLLEGATNPKYAYSHQASIRAAYQVLEIRRAMDEVEPEIGLKPARFWTVMHHVFFAALILAMDVACNPQAPDAEARKAKVLAAYQTLEKSKHESGNLMEGIQKNLQTLMTTLQRQRSHTSVGGPNEPCTGYYAGDSKAPAAPPGNRQPSSAASLPQIPTSEDEGGFIQPPATMMDASDLAGGALANDLDETGWEKLWSEFVAVAPDLDVGQWNALLEDVDLSPHIGAY